MRATLKDLYGIEAKDNIWYNGRPRGISHGAELGLETDGPVGVTLNWLTQDQNLDVMLDHGEVDVAYGFPPGTATVGGFITPDRYAGTPLEGNPRIKLLLVDAGKAVIEEFYRKTKAFQANHHVIVQNRVLREHPWVALELYKAFQRSKQVALEGARRAGSAYLYFPGHDAEGQAAVYGDDPYPLGIRAMGRTIERAIQGSLEQGLIRVPVSIEDVYYRTTWDT